MHSYIAYITPQLSGITKPYALLSVDLSDARQEARLLAAAIFPGQAFTFSVRAV